MKIVYHDVDGCLNADASTPIPIGGEPLPLNQSAKLRELGRKLDASSIDYLVINTGRSMEDTLAIARDINSPKLRYIIAEHGAEYHDMKNDKLVELQGSIGGKLDVIRNFIAWYRETGADILNKRIGATVPVLDKGANLTLDARNGLDSEKVHIELKALVKHDSPFDDDQLVFHHSKADGFVDAMGQINKGDGIQVVSALLAGSQSAAEAVTSIAIGNGLNDMPMLEVASIPVCPANAEPEVREYCRSHGGVASTYEFIDATLHWLEDQT